MRRAHFEVNDELLREALHLPASATIVAVWTTYGHNGLNSVHFVVDDYMIPEAPGPHDCEPVITHERYSWDWNVKP